MTAAKRSLGEIPMSILSRRKMLLGSVSVLAIFGAVLYARSGSGTTTLQFFDNKEKPTISFVQVRKTLDPYVDALIERSEKDFGVKYSEADRQRIHTRVWDKIQLVFSEAYNPKEAGESIRQ
jgi:hypothetical protein